MSQPMASNPGPHCLPQLQQFGGNSIGHKMDLFKFKNKYGKDLKHPFRMIIYDIFEVSLTKMG